MRPPPNSIHEYLYRLLIDSPGFNNWVRKIHARINRIPLEQVFPEETKYSRQFDIHDYTPTNWQKVNAFRKIWSKEMKETFKFW
ncbi:hypothetical protein LELG_04664 [Lodderomyces elongisporus NRRL YB-4239]|uniref:Uncharacterized protein n=1 Tax=Lodderomyces elongisporus (strain ATCC 11503 / CBS 2605 / JCM 1781 / NBRC 1676 / NRRL YB-4239) TaxID=379508 RepID=A5E4X5_LODEL|nr:hypothetical protein LELG_04664 [Lodderomyces elongisporus NRRL YB-4239]